MSSIIRFTVVSLMMVTLVFGSVFTVSFDAAGVGTPLTVGALSAFANTEAPTLETPAAPVAPVLETPEAPVAPVVEVPEAPAAPVLEVPEAPAAPVLETPALTTQHTSGYTKVCKLVVHKSVDKTSAVPGDVLTYTITVKNEGKADCTGGGVRIVDVHSSYLTFVSQSHSSNLLAGYGNDPVYHAGSRTLRWNGQTLSPGESGTITFKAKVVAPQTCGNFTIDNEAKATAKELNNFKTWVYSGKVTTHVNHACEEAKPVCTLAIDKTSVAAGGGNVVLTWTTENADTASFNRNIGNVALDGTKTEFVSESSTFVLTATGKGGTVQCSKAVTVSQTEPKPPVCPLEPRAGRTIVTFDKRLRSDQGEANAVTHLKSVNLAAGKYDVTLVAWDGYIGREAVSQPNERYKLELRNASGAVVATSNATTDVADNVREAIVINTVNEDLVVTEAITGLRGVHAVYPDTSSPNSVNALCAAIDVIEEEKPEPECTLTGTPTTLPVGGGNVALTWTTKNADTVTLSEGIGAVDKNGSRTEATTVSKTYTLTATGAGGTVSCPVSVTVPDTPNPLTCSAVTFNTSDNEVRDGSDVTLSWGWNDSRITSASIDQGIGSVANNSNKVVTINNDITYTMTIKSATSEAQCPVSIEVESGGGGGGSSSPRCELEISKKKIKAGEEIELTWETSRATRVVIEDSSKKELLDTNDYATSRRDDYFDGDMELKPTKDTTYTLTASRGSRDRVCKVSVDVENSTVTVTEVRNQPLVAGISLSQVPYTGFEAGPFLTLLFYTILTLWALFVAYLFVIRRDRIAGVSLPGAFGNSPYVDVSREAAPTASVSPAATYVASMTDTAPANLPVATTASPVIGYQAYVAPQSEEEAELSALENRAHSQKALLSSDAMRYLIHTEASLEERAKKLDGVIRVAKVTFPTEDGWIVLNLARMEALLGDLTKGEAVAVATDVTPTAGGSLAEAIVTGNVVAAYAMIQHRPMVALADAAADLDAIFRARKGETVAVSDLLREAGSRLTDEQIANAISALTSAIDGTYRDEAEAVKMAIMKAIKVVA